MHPKRVRNWIFALVLWSLAPCLCGQAEDSDNTRRFIYVPAEKWQAVITAEPKGVMLAYPAYRELADRRLAAETSPQEPVLVQSAEYRAAVEGRILRIEADLKIHCLVSEPSWCNFHLGGLGVASAVLISPDGTSRDIPLLLTDASPAVALPAPEAARKSDPRKQQLQGQEWERSLQRQRLWYDQQAKQGKPAVIAPPDMPMAYAALLPGRGEYLLRVLCYQNLEEQRDELRALVKVGEFAQQTFRLKISKGIEYITDPPHVRLDATGEIVVYLGNRSELSLILRPEENTDVKQPVVTARIDGSHLILAESITSCFEVGFEVNHHPQKTFTMVLPAELEIVQVSENRWDLRQSEPGAPQYLVVQLNEEKLGSYTVQINCRRALLGDSRFSLPEVRVIDDHLLYQEGIAYVEKSSDIRLEVQELREVRQVNHLVVLGEKGPRGASYRLHSFGQEPFLACVFWGPDHGIALKKRLIVPKVESSLVTAVSFYPDSLDSASDITFDVKEGHVKRLLLGLPSGWNLARTSVFRRSNANAPFAEFAVPARYVRNDVLYLPFPEKIGKGEQIKVSLRLDHAPGKWDGMLPLVAPMADRDLELEYQPSFLGVIVDPDYEVTPAALRHIASVDLNLIRSLRIESPNLRLGFKITSPEAQGRLDLKKKESQTSAVAVTYLSIEPNRLLTGVVLVYEIDNAARDSFSFSLPGDFAPQVHVRDASGSIKEIQEIQPGPNSPIRRWRVQLQRKVRGTYTLYLSYESPIHAQSGKIEYPVPPLFLEDDVKLVRGVLAIAATSLAEVGILDTGHTEPLPLARLPIFPHPEFPDHADFLYAFAYTRPDHGLRLGIRYHGEVDLPMAIVENAEISTFLPGDGRERVYCKYSLRHLGMEYFRLALPEGADFWSAVVDERGEKPVRQDGDLAIPLSLHEDGRPNLIELVYERDIEEIRGIGGIDLLRPETPPDIPVRRLSWQVHLPANYHIGPDFRSATAKMRPWYRQLARMAEEAGRSVGGFGAFGTRGDRAPSQVPAYSRETARHSSTAPGSPSPVVSEPRQQFYENESVPDVSPQIQPSPSFRKTGEDRKARSRGRRDAERDESRTSEEAFGDDSGLDADDFGEVEESEGTGREQDRTTTEPIGGESLGVNQVIDGYIQSGQPKAYDIYIPEGQQVTIEMFRTDTSNFDPMVSIENSSGQQIAIDDDGAGYPNSRMTHFLPPGHYRIVAREFGSNDSGSFRLSVRGGAVAAATARPETSTEKAAAARPSRALPPPAPSMPVEAPADMPAPPEPAMPSTGLAGKIAGPAGNAVAQGGEAAVGREEGQRPMPKEEARDLQNAQDRNASPETEREAPPVEASKVAGLRSLSFALVGDAGALNPALRFSMQSWVTSGRKTLSPHSMPSIHIAYVERGTLRNLLTWLIVLSTLGGLFVCFRVRRIHPVLILLGSIAFFTFVPEWFGLWLMPFCNALVWGLLLSTALFCAYRVFARAGRWLKIAPVVLCALWLCGGSELSAQPAPSSETIYVPYNMESFRNLRQIEEVFLPYATYVDLWNRTHPESKIDAVDTLQKPDFILYHAHYQGRIQEKQVPFSVVFLAEAYKGPIQVPLGLGGVAVESVQLAGEGGESRPVSIMPSGSGYAVVLPEKGRYRIEVAFLPQAKIVSRSGEFGFELQPVAASIFEMLMDADLEIDSRCLLGHWREETKAGKKTVTMLPGNRKRIDIQWYPSSQRHLAQGLQVKAFHDHTLEIRDQLLTLRGKIRYEVLVGKTSRLRLLLPREYTLEKLRCSTKLEQWILSITENHTEIVLRLLEETQKEITVEFDATKSIDSLPVRESFPVVSPQGVVSQLGRAQISNHNAYEVFVDPTPNLLDSKVQGEFFTQIFRHAGEATPLNFRIDWMREENVVHSPSPEAEQAYQNRQPGLCVRIDEEKVVADYHAKIEVKGSPIFSYQWLCPAEGQIGVSGDRIKTWRVEPENGRQKLYVLLESSVRKEEAVSVSIHIEQERAGETVSLPCFESPQAARQSGSILVCSSQDLELALEGVPASLLEQDVVDFQAPAGWVRRFAWTYQLNRGESPYRAAFRVQSRNPEMDADAIIQLLVENEWLNWGYYLNYDIRFAGVDTLRFSLPSEFGQILEILGDNIRQAEPRADAQSGLTEWTVSLHNKVRGPYSLSIFPQLQKNEGQEIAVRPVVFLEGKGSPKIVRQRMYVLCENASQYELGPKARNMRGMNPYLFDVAEWHRRQLDRNVIDANLEREFQNNGHPLSRRQAAVTVRTPGEEWLVADSKNEKEYLLIRRDNRMRVYLNFCPSSFPLAGVLRNLTFAYKADGLDWGLQFSQRKREAIRSVRTALQGVEAYTLVDPEGEARHRLLYHLRYGGQQFLELSGLDECRVWAVFAGDAFVRPIQKEEGGKKLVMIPLRATSCGERLDVTLVYSEKIPPMSSGETIRFDLPKVQDLQGEGDLYWTVYLPSDRLYEYGGTVNPCDAVRLSEFQRGLQASSSVSAGSGDEPATPADNVNEALRYAGQYNSLQKRYEEFWEGKQRRQQQELQSLNESTAPASGESAGNYSDLLGRKNLFAANRAGRNFQNAPEGKVYEDSRAVTDLEFDLGAGRRADSPAFPATAATQGVRASVYELPIPPDFRSVHFTKKQGDASLEIYCTSLPRNSGFWLTFQFLGFMAILFFSWKRRLFVREGYTLKRAGLLVLTLVAATAWCFLLEIVQELML